MARSAALDKALVVAALRERLASDLDAAIQSQRRAQEGATHEEARPEHDKDMRATETAYLARGLAQRVAELQHAVGRLGGLQLEDFGKGAPAALSALVRASDEQGREVRYFLAPSGGGLALRVAGKAVRVVTVDSPLGQALIGLRAGDEAELDSPQGARTLTVLEVS